ncbi:serine/threonine protein kinase, variant [Aphanomyces invadans]|nr:serine/threonine protein kinase, variant [Aphanomyces invadans]ETV93652.1 serine/threonine protein kinase, variant [Aphanomyces invadans]|eukprot:XP_008877692.1 serine/threonine protein kinase, variant [Aphanomyces invadans]
MTPFMLAVHLGHGEVVARMLRVAAVVDDINKGHPAALIQACVHGRGPVVHQLLAVPTIDVNVRGHRGRTALHEAVSNDMCREVDALLRHPSIASSVHTVADVDSTPFYHAVERKRVQCVKLFLARPDLDICVGATGVLYAAARERTVEIVQLLLQDGRFPVDETTLDGNTVLHGAALGGNIDIVKRLLAEPNVALNHRNKSGQTALHVAARSGYDVVVALLLENPALHPVNLQDNNEYTPLHHACEAGKERVVSALFKRDDIDVNMTCKAGNTPLIVAIQHRHDSCIKLLLQHPHVQLNHRNKKQDAALFMAAHLSTTSLTLLLGHPGMDLSVKNAKNQTVMQVALEMERWPFVAGLIAHGVPFEVLYKSKLLLHKLVNDLTPASGLRLLLQDLPFSLDPATGAVVPVAKHHYSWTTFMDLSLAVSSELRRQTVQAVVNHPLYARHRASFVRELACATDANGRTALQITDATTRAFLNEQLYFCSRYELFDGPPIHISATAVVVNAYDYGIFKQVFGMHAASGHLTKAAFQACLQTLGQPAVASKSTESQHREVDMWDQNKDGTVSEPEFLRFCDRTYGGKLRVAVKFMRNADEHAREINMRQGLNNADCVLGLLPMADPLVVKEQVAHLTLHHDLDMTAYPCMLVMPAADRSLEDIYLKERPNDNHIRSMLQEVAEMLLQLHANGVVHGDVKKLNVIRVDHHMRLIDMDAATPMHHPVGAKFSSGSLPPEMFYKLKNDGEVAQYTSYWAPHIQENPELWAKVQPRHGWVVKAFHGDPNAAPLPYTLEKATPAVDVWAFGVLMYQMYSGVELVPTDRNQDVDDSSIERAATWTEDELALRIQNKVANPLARDLIVKLLAVDPLHRISVKEMLGHGYFDVKLDSSTALQIIEAKLEKLNDQVTSGFQTMNDRFDQVVELSHVMLKQVGKAKEDLMRGIFQATEVRVPTSFVLLPFNILEKMADDAEGVLDEAANFIRQGMEMGARFMNAVKSSKGIGSVVKLVLPGEPLYLYLIDEVLGAPVVPPLLPDKSKPLYPIKIETKSDEYVAFMATAMPYIQTGFKLLKGVNTVASMAKALGVPSLDKEVLQGVQDKIEHAKKTSSVFDFGVLQDAVEAHDMGAPVHRIRGAALRELERFFDAIDQDKDFAGLGRTYSASGQVLWTSKSTIETFEKAKRPTQVETPSDKAETKSAAGPTAHEIYAQLVKRPLDSERKVLRTPGAVAVMR